MQKAAKQAFQESMKKRLAKKPWIAEYRKLSRSLHVYKSHNVTPEVIPDFSVACRRLTPGPGYLESLCQENVRLQKLHLVDVINPSTL